MENTAVEVAKKLLQINAIKLNPQKPFTWASGLKSPIYCDNRIALSYPEVRRYIINAFAEKANQFAPFDSIAGVATAGIAHGALLASQLDAPFAYVRPKPKAHGRQNQIEGALKPGTRVLVIEDLISTGGSSIKAVDAIRAAGCSVTGVLAIFTYGFEQATQAFSAANCDFDTISDYPTLLQAAIETGYLPSEMQAKLEEWNRNPQKWSEQQR
jgi:orotate phosphoribosyltransferase